MFSCQSILDKNKICYERDTQSLRSELEMVNASFNTILSKYETAQKEIQEHSIAMDELLELCKYNADRFESLTHNNNQCDCEQVPVHCEEVINVPEPISVSGLEQWPSVSVKTDSDCSNRLNIAMYSDETGRSMGLQLGYLLEHRITNNCMPGATYSQILQSILKCKFKSNTVLIILIGRRGTVSKKTIINYFSALNSLPNIKKVMLFAFPFSQSLTENENTIRHNLNLNLHSMTCRHDDKFHFIDTNSILSKYFYLTEENYNLSKYDKRQLAHVLYYYINNIFLGNSLSTLTTAPIEQCYHNLQSLEFVPNDLN